MERKEHFSVRLRPSTIRKLAGHADRRNVSRTAIAEQYLEESIRMADHPGIVFRDGAAGRRPALMGHRLDVARVVQTVREEGGDAERAADYFGVQPALVRAAIGYYAEYRDEVDRWIERGQRLADEAEAAWRSEQAAIGG